MEQRPLGVHDTRVSKLALGAMTFGTGMPPITTVDETLARRIVDRALDRGVNLIDTADAYSGGASEEIVGAAIRGRRDEVLVATKVGFGAPGSGPLAYDNVLAGCEASLRRLGVDHIDLFQLHRPDRTTPIDETLRALDDLVSRGLVRETGASNFRAWEVSSVVAHQRALGRPEFAAVQVYYSLVGRDVEHDILPQCRADGVGLLVWSPLASGFLTGRYRRQGGDAEAAAGGGGRRSAFGFPPVAADTGESVVDALAAIAAARDASIAQVALAWVLGRPGVTSVIIGASSLEQLDENLAAADLVLSVEETAHLDELTAPAPIYPEWWEPAMGVEPPR